MATNVSLIVFVQALGGKFLGPNAFDPGAIQLQYNYGGGSTVLPYYRTGMDDGGISATFKAGASSYMPILTIDGPGKQPAVNYLTPDSQTVCGRADIVMQGSSLSVDLQAVIPRTGGGPLVLRETVTLVENLSTYRIILIAPGLYLSQGQINGNNLSVLVKMMCGCKISASKPGAPAYWPPDDFFVEAEVTFEDGGFTHFSMDFDQVVNDSLYVVTVPIGSPIARVRFKAIQRSTLNYGFLEI